VKRLLAAAVCACSIALALVAIPPRAQAGGLLGGLFGPKASPTPSPTPAPLPTATPEPPQVAIPRLQAKLKEHPDDQQAMLELAAEYLQINRADLALPLTQHLLALGNKTAEVFYYDGAAQETAGNLQAALADFQNASDLDPTNLAILAQLAQVDLQLGHAADAERIANRAIVFHKDDAQAYVLLGQVYLGEKKIDQARAEFEKAAAIDPKNVEPIYQIANIYAQQKNPQMALRTVERALQLNPSDVQALIFRAEMYGEEHDDTAMRRAFADALVAASTDEQKAAVLAREADYYAGHHDDADAERVLKEAISRYPKVASAYLQYGDFLAARRRLADASTQWRRALDVEPDDPGALGRIGQYELEHGDTNKAIGYLLRLTKVAPSAQSYALLGEAYSSARRYAQAREACARSFDYQRTPEMLGCIAGSDFELKRYAEAAKIFSALDQAAPGFLDGNPQLLYIAAHAYAHDGRKAAALDAYRRLLAMMRKGTASYKKIEAEIAALTGGRTGKRG
jgi:tetratricopeptide (TPR) repeat protein